MCVTSVSMCVASVSSCPPAGRVRPRPTWEAAAAARVPLQLDGLAPQLELRQQQRQQRGESGVALQLRTQRRQRLRLWHLKLCLVHAVFAQQPGAAAAANEVCVVQLHVWPQRKQLLPQPGGPLGAKHAIHNSVSLLFQCCADTRRDGLLHDALDGDGVGAAWAAIGRGHRRVRAKARC